jgi:hypothetical protein
MVGRKATNAANGKYALVFEKTASAEAIRRIQSPMIIFDHGFEFYRRA